MGATKKTLHAAEAAKLLEVEFARLKPEACKTCKAPVPFWGPGVITGTGYWYVRMIPPCPHQCGRMLSKLWSEITTEYEIERSAIESGQARFRDAQGPVKRPPR